jgi:hypothetical protein
MSYLGGGELKVFGPPALDINSLNVNFSYSL